MITYVKPSEVHAPKRHWSLIHVLFDGGKGESSLAIGRWDNKPVLAMRWNGRDENPLGNPQSRGLPTWFVIPHEYRKQILESEPFKSIHNDAMALARNFLELKRVYFLSPRPNPSCPDYQKLALQTFHTSELGDRLKDLERDELKLYHIICDASWVPGLQEKGHLSAVLTEAWETYCLAPNRDHQFAS